MISSGAQAWRIDHAHTLKCLLLSLCCSRCHFLISCGPGVGTGACHGEAVAKIAAAKMAAGHGSVYWPLKCTAENFTGNQPVRPLWPQMLSSLKFPNQFFSDANSDAFLHVIIALQKALLFKPPNLHWKRETNVVCVSWRCGAARVMQQQSHGRDTTYMWHRYT